MAMRLMELPLVKSGEAFTIAVANTGTSSTASLSILVDSASHVFELEGTAGAKAKHQVTVLPGGSAHFQIKNWGAPASGARLVVQLTPGEPAGGQQTIVL